MTNQQVIELVRLIAEKQINFEEGLTNHEILRIESKFNLKFPPDLKIFLQTNLPVSKGFVNWREGLVSENIAKNIISRINLPLDGMIFDIKSNNFWFDQWGDKPENINDRIELATKFYYTYPKLLPIYSHRYIPSEPQQVGNPVFSVNQMDIIYYGFDLASYFAKEFNFDLPDDFEILTEPNVEIEFWSYWTVYN